MKHEHHFLILFCILHSAFRIEMSSSGTANVHPARYCRISPRPAEDQPPAGREEIMPTRVLLLRHAESANPLIFHGAESDVGLGERGRRQAEAIAAVLAAEGPDVVVSSAMRRARETAAPIVLACDVPLR